MFFFLFFYYTTWLRNSNQSLKSNKDYILGRTLAKKNITLMQFRIAVDSWVYLA